MHRTTGTRDPAAAFVLPTAVDDAGEQLLAAAETAAGDVSGVQHVHALGRWTGRTLRLELEGWVDGSLTVAQADRVGEAVASAVGSAVPEVRSLTWSARSV